MTDKTKEFIKKAISVHRDKYDYSKVEYINCDLKIIIICKTHGEFEQKPAEHLSGCGCKQCGFTKISMSKTYSTYEYIQRVKEIHQNIYNYTLTEYNGIYNNIEVLCKIHGLFETNAKNHLNGHGCPRCANVKQYSKAQIQWLNFIQLKDNITIQHAENDCEFKIPNTRFSADGYCKETNTIYEFHGSYWHGDPKLFNSNDYNKTTNCTNFLKQIY